MNYISTLKLVSRNHTVVLANGCFDLLHVGHIWHLEAARALGDRLVVALTLDEYVNKGPHRPVYPWAHRAELLQALRCVDSVIPSVGAIDAIRKVNPDIFVKGADYQGSPLLDPTIEVCRKLGIELRVLDTPKLSSTAIYDRLRQG